MVARERVVPSVLAGAGAVLAGVLVGSGLADRSGGPIEAVVVQAVMPRFAVHPLVPDPADPSAPKGASVGRRMAIAVRGAPAGHGSPARRRVADPPVARHAPPPATARAPRSAPSGDPKRVGLLAADPPAPLPATRPRSHRAHHRHF